MDFFFLLGFWVQNACVMTPRTPQFPISILALVLTPSQLLLAGYSVRKETKTGMMVVVVSFVVDIGFIALLLFTLYGSDGPPLQYYSVRPRLAAYAALALPLLVGTIAVAVICTANFNKGLKRHLQRSSIPGEWEARGRHNEARAEGQYHSQQLEMLPTRLEIE